MRQDLKHIAFGINNSHSKYIRVVIRSIALNNKDYNFCIHILNDGISNLNKKRLEKEVSRYSNLQIKYYNIDLNLFDGVVSREWHISAWYRILLPLLLNEDIKKILYLDSDTLINGELKDLYNLNLKDYCLAAVTDLKYFKESNLKRLPMIKSGIYVCSGVMLLNLEYWRKINVTEKILSFAKNYPSLLVFPDQDAINVICDGTIMLLPLEYGYVSDFKTKKDSIIFHYGYLKPWKFIKNSPYFHIWEKYNNSLIKPINLFIPKLRVSTKSQIYKLIKFLGMKT